MITQFAIFKNNNKKEGSKEPDYNLSTKIGEEFVDIGAAWIKEGKNGKYFSIQLKKPYKDKKGYYLESYKEGDISE